MVFVVTLFFARFLKNLFLLLIHILISVYATCSVSEYKLITPENVTTYIWTNVTPDKGDIFYLPEIFALLWSFYASI